MTSTTKKENIKVAVGLSGGVDSSVAAYLLKKEGYDVVGVHLQCWDYKADGCSGKQDRTDAVKVAAKLGIKFVALNFEQQYKEKVINHFFEEYKAGRTPNPDVMCNKEIKFGLFLDWAIENGFDYVATGHYARVVHEKGSNKLLMGVDTKKDQSYFLYLVTQAQLGKVFFPLGNLKKTKVRSIAEEAGFHTATKKDSVGICFIGDIDVKEFLKERIKEEKGDVLDINGEVIGEHDGVPFYTIGQRHGFRVNKYHGLPMYVIKKDARENTITVGFAKDGNVDSFEVSELHWQQKIDDFVSSENVVECSVRIRHLGELYPASLMLNKGNKTGTVNLKDSIFGVAPGQSAVFYKEDLLLGGGVIN